MKEVSFGHYQSAKLTEKGIQLNVDRVAIIFNKGGKLINLIEQLCTEMRSGPQRRDSAPPRQIEINESFKISSNEHTLLNNELKGLDFEVDHISYKPKNKIFAIIEKIVSQIMINQKLEDGQTTKVSAKVYFERVYKDYLDRLGRGLYPNLPCNDRLGNSVSSVVATFDRNMINYYSRCVVQSKLRLEIVQLNEITKEMLDDFKKENNFYPDFLLVYRDGISEDQFNEVVVDKEINLMKKAFCEINPNYNPKTTFIVVQKIHHTRFLPVNEHDRISKSQNVLPGTCVDNNISYKPKNNIFAIIEKTVSQIMLNQKLEDGKTTKLSAKGYIGRDLDLEKNQSNESNQQLDEINQQLDEINQQSDENNEFFTDENNEFFTDDESN